MLNTGTLTHNPKERPNLYPKRPDDDDNQPPHSPTVELYEMVLVISQIAPVVEIGRVLYVHHPMVRVLGIGSTAHTIP